MLISIPHLKIPLLPRMFLCVLIFFHFKYSIFSLISLDILFCRKYSIKLPLPLSVLHYTFFFFYEAIICLWVRLLVQNPVQFVFWTFRCNHVHNLLLVKLINNIKNIIYIKHSAASRRRNVLYSTYLKIVSYHVYFPKNYVLSCRNI